MSPSVLIDRFESIAMSASIRSLCAAALVTGLFAIPFNTAYGADDAPVAKDQKIASVTVERAQMREVIGRVPVSGSLVPLEEVLVYPQINGYLIETLNVDIGDVVSAGDTMVLLAKNTLSVQVVQAEAELTRAEAAIGQAASSIDTANANKVQTLSLIHI